MTVELWRIATDTPDYTADDISGEGAKRSGGRWNRAGLAVTYTAGSIALACLETIVHLGASNLPLNRYLVRIDVPDAVWARASLLDLASAPVGWDALPAGRVSLDLGDAWLVDPAGEALFRVPSVIVPEENNVLINPAHLDAGQLVATKVRKWLYDSRVWV